MDGVTVSVDLDDDEKIEFFYRVVKELNNFFNKSTERQSDIDVMNLPTGKSWADIVDNELDKKKTVPSETPKRASKKTVPSETPKRASKNTQQRKARRAKRKADLEAKNATARAEMEAEIAEMEAEKATARAEMEDDFKKVLHRKTRKAGHKHVNNLCAFGECCRNEECERFHTHNDEWPHDACRYGVYCRNWQKWWHSRDPTDMCPYDHSYHRRFKGFVPQS